MYTHVLANVDVYRLYGNEEDMRNVLLLDTEVQSQVKHRAKNARNFTDSFIVIVQKSLVLG